MGPSCDPTSKLCSLCNKLDIRALHSKATKGSKREKSIIWHDFERNDLDDDSLPIFKHHANLLELKRAAPNCYLCHEIWRTFCGNAGLPEDISDTDLSSGLSDRPLYAIFGDEEAQNDRLPKLAILQHARHELTRVVASFDICISQDSQPSDVNYRFARVLHPFSGSEECMSLVRQWMNTCETLHRSCKERREALKSPARLIDLQGDAHLIDATGEEVFVALSYSWGGESALMLKADTDKQFRRKLPAEALPPTMRDAVFITNNLGIRYLWIDAICIFQDSKDDFAAEGSKMRDIYRGAVLTINGTSAAKISDSLFVHRTFRHVKLPWRNGKKPQEYIYLREESQATQHKLKSAPVNTRGWCLQESLLARRSFWIGEQQMLFECAVNQVDESGRRAVATEDYRSMRFINGLSSYENSYFRSWLFRAVGIPSVTFIPFLTVTWRTFLRTWDVWRLFRRWTYKAYLPPALIGPNDDRLTLYDYWREILYQYTSRQLTKASDTFPALSGLADAFHRATGEDYLAGVWKGDLIRSLSWNRRVPYWKSEQEELMRTHEKFGYIAPSWSWASVIGGEVKFSPAMPNTSVSESNYKPIQTARVLSAWTKPATSDKHGSVSHGEVVLRGPFIEVPHPLQPPSAASTLPHLHQYVHRLVLENGSFAFEFQLKHREQDGQRFGFFQTSIEREVNVSDPVMEMELLLIETCREDSKSASTSGETSLNEENRTCWRRLTHFAIRLSGRQGYGFDAAELREEMKGVGWQTKTVCII